MALSFYSNWGAMDHHLTVDHGGPYDQQPQAEQFDMPITFHDPLDVPDLPSDPIFEALNEYFINDADANVLPTHFPSFSDPSVLSLPTDLQRMPDPYEEIYHCPYPKRAKSFNDLYHPPSFMFGMDSFDASIHGMMAATDIPTAATANCSMSEFLPEFVVPPPKMELVQMPAMQFCCGSSGEKKANVGGNGGGSLSAQSVAARERRKRISDKTQELGRLIPGWNKMNTAEMFQAAACYVKFLQAQVGILGLLGQFQEEDCGGELPNKGDQVLPLLLTSPAVQEKLYRAEKCIVPKEMVVDLAKDRAIKSHPSISRDLGKFMEAMEEEPAALSNENGS